MVNIWIEDSWHAASYICRGLNDLRCTEPGFASTPGSKMYIGWDGRWRGVGYGEVVPNIYSIPSLIAVRSTVNIGGLLVK
jgi:hypothetical protein